MRIGTAPPTTVHYRRTYKPMALRSGRDKGASVPLPEILKLDIGQYNARIRELRERGFVIENQMVHVDGVIHSSYQLAYDPERDSLVQS